MKKRQWRLLLTEILEARNAHEAYHAMLANRIEELRRTLDTINAKLRVIQTELEDALAARAFDPEEHNADLRRGDHGPIGVIPQEAVGWHDPNTTTGTGWRPHAPDESFQELHTYVLQEDGTTRECEP